MENLIEILHTFAIYEANGFLVLSYVVWEQMAAILTAAAFLYLLKDAPQGQRLWIGGAAMLAIAAAFLTAAPAPMLLCVMSVAGAAAVALDRFNPDSLRWRIVGGLTLYALAALAHLSYSSYLAGVDAAAWAQAIGGQGGANATLAQGRSFVETLATWGLWLILPLGYFSLLVQVLLAHPPLPQTPEDLITAVRTRSQRTEVGDQRSGMS